jgi:hypothetical protein
MRVGAAREFAKSALVVAALIGCASGTRHPAAEAASADAETKVADLAARRNFQSVSIDRKQTLAIRGKAGGKTLLVSGRARAAREDGQLNDTCFAALVRHAGSVELLLTVGYGDWEAVACRSIVAVGVLPGAVATRVALIYQAKSPNYAVREAVVLRWTEAPGSFAIDREASKRASEAGAQTIDGLRRALR